MNAPLHPGDIIRMNYLDALGISIEELSVDMDVESTILNALIERRISITYELATRLANRLGTPKDYWIDLQRNFDSHSAKQREPHPSQLFYDLKRFLEKGGDPESISWLQKVK